MNQLRTEALRSMSQGDHDLVYTVVFGLNHSLQTLKKTCA